MSNGNARGRARHAILTQRHYTETAIGRVSHLRMHTAIGIVEAPVLLEPAPARELPMPKLGKDGRFQYVMPGGAIVTSLNPAADE